MSAPTQTITPRNVKLLPCVVYGVALAMLVFYAIRSGWIQHPLVDRYVTGHPVSYVETIMLCVGLLSLVLKAIGLLQERRFLAQWQDPALEELPFLEDDWKRSGESDETSSSANLSISSDAEDLEETDGDREKAEKMLRILELRQRLKSGTSPSQSTLTQRLTAVLNYVRNRRTAEGVDVHLKHLAQQDADAQYESYSLIRLMVWAIPMLGFLGTVLGISEALGGLDLGANADLSALIGNLKSSLYVAFDTTALALSYGVVLMFFQFALDRSESSFVQQVDRQTEAFVLSSFATNASDKDSDPVAQSIRKMGQALLKATFSLVEHQHDLWNESLTAAQDAWISATENSQHQADHVLREVVDGATDRLVDKLRSAVDTADQQMEHRWHQWQVTLSDNARSICDFQKNATSHIEMLQQFFQSASHLSDEQQAAIQSLVGRLDNLVEQSRELQHQQQQEMKNRVQREDEERRQHELAQWQRQSEEKAARLALRQEIELKETFVGPLTLPAYRELCCRMEQRGLEEGWIPAEKPVRPAPPAERERLSEPEPESRQPVLEPTFSDAIETRNSGSSTVADPTTQSPLAGSIPEISVRPGQNNNWATWNPFHVHQHRDTHSNSSIAPSEVRETSARESSPVTSVQNSTRAGSLSQSAGNDRSQVSPPSLKLHAERSERDDEGVSLVTLEAEETDGISPIETQRPNVRSVLIPFRDARVRRAS